MPLNFQARSRLPERKGSLCHNRYDRCQQYGRRPEKIAELAFQTALNTLRSIAECYVW